MKKNIEIASAALFVVCGILASCAKENTPDDKSSGEETYIVNFIGTIKSEEPQESQEISKTGFVPVGDKQQIWWKNGDKIAYVQLYTDEGGSKKFSRQTGTVTGGDFVQQVSHSISFPTPKEDTEVAFSSFAPNSSYIKNGTLYKSGKLAWVLKTPNEQYPSADNFDPLADLLFSEQNGYEEYVPGEKTFSLVFHRKVALARMKVSNLPTDEAIDTIKIFAFKSGAAVALAGETTFDPTKTSDEYGDVSKEAQLILDYSGKSIKASGDEGMTAFFCCYPFELGEGDKLQILVQTASHLYYRVITLSGEQSLKLVAGRATNFSVDMESSTLAVAKLGSTYYPSFESAVTAANKKTTESTLTILENITLTSSASFTNTNAITLDLNGKTLSANGSKRINVAGGKLVFSDSSNGTGIYKQTTTDAYAIKLSDNASLTLNGGTISSAENSTTITVYATENSTVEINSGTITNLGENRGLYADSGKITISGGTISSSKEHALYIASESNEIQLSISGGSFTSGAETSKNKYAAYLGSAIENSSFSISGGYFYSNYSAVYAKYGTVNISGGHFYSFDSSSEKPVLCRHGTNASNSATGGCYGCNDSTGQTFSTGVTYTSDYKLGGSRTIEPDGKIYYLRVVKK